MAHLDMNNVRGNVMFSQHSNTTVNITFNLESSLRNFTNISAQIRSYPVAYSPTCKDYGKVVHDLSATHGFISYSSKYMDTTINISGINAILGRTLVLFDGSTPIACGTILPNAMSTYAKVAISSSKIAGSFEFLQNGNGDTMIYGQIVNADGTSSQTTGHNWYIANTCDDSGNMFNPTSVSGSCSSQQENSCKIGALRNKFGNLTIGFGSNTTFFGIDKHLSLYDQQNSIISHALVIYDKVGAMIGCGEIKKSGPLVVTSNFIAANHQGINGMLSFHQPSPYHATNLTVDLSGLSDRAGAYHVHMFPIADASNPSCAVSSVGGHLNPFGAVTNTLPPNQSVDKYEIGDLSSKFGTLVNRSSYFLNTMDANLPLYGLNTIIGRSIVIHNNDDTATRLTCSNIEPVGARVLSATANYTANSISVLNGFITIKQYRLSNGVMSPTIMVVQLTYRSNSSKKSNDHNWHVHKNTIGKKSNCADAGPHYNPAAVSTTNPTYSQQCNETYPYRCEVGDASNKVGQYSIGVGKSLYADVDTPLFNAYTSLGHSIVYHTANGGAPRLACADVIPNVGNDVAKFNIDIKQRNLMGETASIGAAIAKALNLGSWRIVYVKSFNSAMDPTNCFQVSFYLINNTAPAFRDKIKKNIIDKTNLDSNMKYKICKKPQRENAGASYTPSIMFVFISIIMAGLVLIY